MHTAKGDYLDKDVEQFVGSMMPFLDERMRRIFLGGLAEMLGKGAAKELSALTDVSEATISKGHTEIMSSEHNPKARMSPSERGRIRAEGGGRKSISESDPEAIEMLLGLLEGNTLGDPSSLLTWTTKSTRNLSDEMKSKGKKISHMSVHRILDANGFSMQSNKKYMESGNPGPDRDAQFRFINEESKRTISEGNPVISIDTKKKEIIGNFKNNGQEIVNDHDFAKEKAVPYGIYDVNANEGFVSVGISADTAEFAVNSIQTWWDMVGKVRYPESRELMITADCGGSNGRRSRLWRVKLQEFADRNNLTVNVRHFPPGTSKWNKIEHRMFSHISMNWKGIPLESLELIVNLIGSTTTRTGLKIKCVEDRREYEKGIKINDDELKSLNIVSADNNPEWNYTIHPRESIQS